MNINGFEKLSMVDYPNEIAATIFTSGCNFRCPFCHNGPLVEHQTGTVSETEVLSYLAKRRGVITGLCISGGEPLLQKDLEAFIKKVKAMGFKIKIDTNGTNPVALKNLIDKKLIDYVAMDIKSAEDNYAQVCGLENVNLDSIKKSIEILKTGSVDYEFRTTLIKEFHSPQILMGIAELIAGAKKIALQKFVYRPTCIAAQKLHEVPREDAEIYKEFLSPYVEEVVLRGYII